MITVIVIVGSTIDGRHMYKCVYYMHFSILFKLYTPPVNIPFGKFIFVFHFLHCFTSGISPFIKNAAILRLTTCIHQFALLVVIVFLTI